MKCADESEIAPSALAKDGSEIAHLRHNAHKRRCRRKFSIDRRLGNEGKSPLKIFSNEPRDFIKSR
jgi:hypothetical protein